MPRQYTPICRSFERGVVMLSLDTEQIWGYLDQMAESRYREHYRDALDAHPRLLRSLTGAGISATWFLVGGMSLDRSGGSQDPRMAGLPREWASKIPEGDQRTAPVWYRRQFALELRDAQPAQEVGLHGGLTHLIWNDPQATPQVAEWELKEGIKALEEISIRPLSFSFAREREAYHALLPAH